MASILCSHLGVSYMSFLHNLLHLCLNSPCMMYHFIQAPPLGHTFHCLRNPISSDYFHVLIKVLHLGLAAFYVVMQPNFLIL